MVFLIGEDVAGIQYNYTCACMLAFVDLIFNAEQGHKPQVLFDIFQYNCVVLVMEAFYRVSS